MKRRVYSGESARPASRKHRVSLCTTCMGRLADLSRTLPTNIELNRDYGNVEFVVLDYNSSDGLEDWMRSEMRQHIESGLVSYYRTDEPQFYSMTHSRNLAFKVASGEIVCNVDADNLTLNVDLPQQQRPKASFAETLNLLANQCPERAFFAKGRQLMRGRLGFFKWEFIHLLGGYDEQLVGYGHDDHDLRNRAWALGFTMVRFSRDHMWRFKTGGAKKNENMQHPSWKATETRNKALSEQNLAAGRYQANVGKHWGKARLIKNFTQEIEV
ncbi:MAG: glycosyltransferase [Pirellulaceae bacterium]